jgi:hypothetical protein
MYGNYRQVLPGQQQPMPGRGTPGNPGALIKPLIYWI